MSVIENMNLESEDLVADRVEQMKTLFPEIATEGDGSIDFEKLRLILGDEVNDDDERYAFTWPGKRNAIRQSQTPSTATLRPDESESRSRDGKDGSFDSDNLYIEGDNLEVLKLLQHSYHGKVKMIYIDPPYNTGNDFVYHDSFGDSIANYKRQAGLSGQSNANTSGRYHSNWCSMMYPRLKLARELLSNTGVLFISIDDNEVKTLRALCDEVFGESSFIADIIWKHTQQSKNDERFFSRQYNHTLCFAKQRDSIEAFSLNRTATDNINYSNPDDDPNGDWRSGDVRSPNYRQTLCFDIIAPDGSHIAPPDNGWRWSQESIRKKVGSGEIIFKPDNSGIIRKIYLKDQSGRTPENLWAGDRFGTTRTAASEIKALFDGHQVFDTPKPKELIENMIELMHLDNSLIVDFFAGSSSSAHAVMNYNAKNDTNNKYILVQIPEKTEDSSIAHQDGFPNLCSLGKERIRRAGSKIAAEIEESNRQLKIGEDPKPIPDIGFRAFKLDESGINKQDLTAAMERGELFGGNTLFDNVVKPDRSDMDIVFEMMLKWGLELTLPIESIEVAGYPCYSVADGELVCCMAGGLTVEALEAIAELEPRRVLMLDSILTDTLKLNAVQIFKRVGERTGVEVELRTV